MKKFTFRLESALHWRLAQLKSAELRLQAMIHEQKTVELERNEIQVEYQRCEESTRADAECRGASLAALARYRLACLKSSAALGLRLANLGATIETQKALVLSARRDHELLIKLRERAASEWEIENNRIVEAEASEAFLIRWSQD